MKKYRIAFTVHDYYDCVGTNPYYSIKERMLESIPEKFRENGYNIKFKRIKLYPWYYKYYRVHMSVRMTEEEIKQVFLDLDKNTSLRLSNVSYKLITKHF